MSYEYRIYGDAGGETLLATLAATQPLPHIHVGNALQLETSGYHQTSGYHLEIRAVEVYVFAPGANHSPQRVQVSVFVRQRDRIALQRILDGKECPKSVAPRL